MTDKVGTFDPKRYWEQRLTHKYSLGGVGDIRFPLSYNKVLYRLRGNAFRSAVRANVSAIKGAAVLDVGSGSGFYVNLWERLGANVTGSDLTDHAVAELEKRFVKSRFLAWDAGGSSFPLDCVFDIVSAFDVFFHIVDDDRFAQAICNVSSVLKEGGYFFYSDYFMRESEKRMEHIVFRNRQGTTSVMLQNGLVEVFRCPVFYFMNSPVVSRRRLPNWGFRLMLKIATRSEFFGLVVGNAASILERLCLSCAREATGTELVVYRKQAAPECSGDVAPI